MTYAPEITIDPFYDKVMARKLQLVDIYFEGERHPIRAEAYEVDEIMQVFAETGYIVVDGKTIYPYHRLLKVELVGNNDSLKQNIPWK